MGTRTGTVGVARLMTVALLALCVLLVAALAAPTKAEAHQKAGRTLIYLDGELVKETRDDHFTYSRRLSPGCHRVEVDRLEGGSVVKTAQRECNVEASKLVVRVDHYNVSITTTTTTASD